MMVVRILSISFGLDSSDPVLALLSFSISSAVCYLAFLLWLTFASGGSVINMLIILCQASMVSLPVLALVYGFNHFFQFAEINVLVDIVISTVAAILAYIFNYRLWKYHAKT